jgi:hypothetical protein
MASFSYILVIGVHNILDFHERSRRDVRTFDAAGVFHDKMKKDWAGEDDVTLCIDSDDYMVIGDTGTHQESNISLESWQDHPADDYTLA